MLLFTTQNKERKRHSIPPTHLVKLLLEVSHLRGLQRPRHYPQRHALLQKERETRNSSGGGGRCRSAE